MLHREKCSAASARGMSQSFFRFSAVRFSFALRFFFFAFFSGNPPIGENCAM